MADRDSLPVIDPNTVTDDDAVADDDASADRDAAVDDDASADRDAAVDDDASADRDAVADEDARASPTVHGVVLAAGTSSRYGDANKLLEPVDGEALVKRAVRTVRASTVDGVTVVLGYEAARVRDAVADLGVEVRTNDAFEAGQSTSVATGVAAAREHDADAVLVALGDMPDVAVETVDLLLETYRRGASDALAAASDGVRGNPVVFDRQHFDALEGVDGDIGGRQILRDDPDAVAVETGDQGVLRDVDHPEDLTRRERNRETERDRKTERER